MYDMPGKALVVRGAPERSRLPGLAPIRRAGKSSCRPLPAVTGRVSALPAVLCDILSGQAMGTTGTARVSVAPWGLESVHGHTEFDVRPGLSSGAAVSEAAPYA